MSFANRTVITEIILLGFSNDPKVNGGLFVLFFLIYMTTVLGNILIICLIIISPQLRTPMYFFLCMLSFLDLCNSSFVTPRLLSDLLSAQRVMSLGACVVQYYSILLLGGAECQLLVLMAYDRYVAICRPLHYPVLMRWSICYRLTAIIWINGFMVFVVPSLAAPVALCNPNQVNHYMCELLAISKLTCSKDQLSELSILFACFIGILLPFIFIIVTYICIISSVLQIKSAGRSKAFSTCTSHIIVVTLYFGTGMTLYFGSPSEYLASQGKYISVFANVVCPMLNPIIYSLKNKDVTKTIINLFSYSTSI